jgi:5-methyltetrahydrofolate--homocysteine methyltransferase
MADYSRFPDADWPQLEESWNAWWAGELQRPMIVLETREQREGTDWADFDFFLTQFPEGAPIDDLLDHSQFLMDATHYYADAYPKWDCNFGAGNVAGFLGASWSHDHDAKTTWFHCPPTGSLSEVVVDVDVTNPFWQRVLAATRGATQRWGKQAAIGFADLGGNLDILASLRGTQPLLYDLYDAPEQLERLCHQVTDAWLRYYDELDALIAPVARGSSCWAPLWSPTRAYMLQSDFSYMIGPPVFERFVLPDLERCCAAVDFAFYHMDGKGQLRHLDRLLSIEKLRGIQWQPGDGAPLADQWPEVLHRIRAAGKLCQIYVDRAGAFRVAREHAGGKGFVFSILEPLTDDTAAEFLEAFRREFH